jgi:hypothetical protein
MEYRPSACQTPDDRPSSLSTQGKIEIMAGILEISHRNCRWRPGIEPEDRDCILIFQLVKKDLV